MDVTSVGARSHSMITGNQLRDKNNIRTKTSELSCCYFEKSYYSRKNILLAERRRGYITVSENFDVSTSESYV